MEIIAHNNGTVNITINNSFGAELDMKPQREKWQDRKRRSKEMALKMLAAGENKRARRMEACGEYIVAQECPECGQMHVVSTKLCRDRLCPLCQWRLSMKRFATMYTIVDGLMTAYPEYKWQFVTLTLRNCSVDQLSSTLNLMSNTWNKIASNKTFKEFYVGWARSLEITYNAEQRTLHPHYHVLVMRRSDRGKTYLQQSWMRVLQKYTSYQAQHTEEIEMTEGDEINRDAILETYKYTIKEDDAMDMPLWLFKQLLTALKNRRLVAFGGKIKEFAADCQLENIEDCTENDETEAAAIIKRCIRCGHQGMVDVVGRWCRNGYVWRES